MGPICPRPGCAAFARGQRSVRLASAVAAKYQALMARPTTPHGEDEADLSALLSRMRAGERRAVARVVTELERHSSLMPRLLDALQPYLGHALVVGFTGPPGAGKSTLLNAYTRYVRTQGQTVGIIAVDPSSPISGGAILGDRIRMTATLDDDGVFMRSLANRGHLGGLCPAAVRVIDALDGAGKDLVLLETVGTGQSEIDIAEVADVRVVILAPGFGDDIQAMKSGLLEIADIIVVNKADREGADRTMQQLMSALSIRPREQSGVPVLKTTATSGEGIVPLAAAIAEAGRRQTAGDPLERRRRRARYLIARAAADRLAERVKTGGGRALDALVDAVLLGTLSPDEAARRLLDG
jgi:GTPase